MRAGLNSFELMEKYQLSFSGFLNALDKLVELKAAHYNEVWQRFPLRNQKIIFHEERTEPRNFVLDRILAFDIDDPTVEGRVQNISQNGLQIAGILAKENQVRNFLITFEGISAFCPFVLRAECRWARLDPKTSVLVSGFEIVEITEKARCELKNLLTSVSLKDKEKRIADLWQVEEHPTDSDDNDLFVETLEAYGFMQNDVSASGSFRISMQPERFGLLLNGLPIPCLLLDETFTIITANEHCLTLGIGRKDFVGTPFMQFFPEVNQQVQSLMDDVFQKRTMVSFIATMRIFQRDILSKLSIRSIRSGEQRLFVIALQDLTREMRMINLGRMEIEQLETAYKEVLKRLADCQAMLMESRGIMKYLIGTLEERINEEKEKLSLSIRFHFKPIIERLKAEKLPEQRLSLINALEYFLEDLLSMSKGRISRIYCALSQRESEICDLILAGYGTKAIAESLGVSLETIASHRSRIRKKLSVPHDQSLYNWLKSHLDTVRELEM